MRLPGRKDSLRMLPTGLQAVSGRKSLPLPTSANVPPQGQAEPVSASYDEEAQTITLDGKAQDVHSWWPKSKKT